MASITNQLAAQGTALAADLLVPLTAVGVEDELDGARPPRRCVAYWDLKREDCARLFPPGSGGRARSPAFRLAGGGRGQFFLWASCDADQLGGFPCFGLFLEMQQQQEADDEAAAGGAARAAVVMSTVDVEYEFAARTRPSGEFLRSRDGEYAFSGGKAVGYRNLLTVPWPAFVAEDSAFFVDGVLHLRATLTVKQP